jgi:hypothetical protein
VLSALQAGVVNVRGTYRQWTSAATRVAVTPRTPNGGRVNAGEAVEGAVAAHGSYVEFELTAPSDGTLVVQLSWDPRQGRLELDLADRIFANFPDNWSPIVGKLSVVAGGKYRVRVADGAPWDYDDMFVLFVLSTSMNGVAAPSSSGRYGLAGGRATLRSGQ